MRAIDPELQQRLDSGATTLCRCWRLTRADGVRMGFTDHDEVLVFDGTSFEAASGLTPSALEQSAGLNVDNSQIVGALSSAGLTEADIARGRYDGAKLEHWLVDWQRPDLRILVFSGVLGEISRGQAGFEAELRGQTEELSRPVGRVFLRDCDAVFGDARCGLDIMDPAFSATATVVNVLGQQGVEVSGLGAFQEGWFTRGRLDWLSGANAGAMAQVKADLLRGTIRVLELWEEAVDPIQPGDSLRVYAGCDKRFATCRDKFTNISNFRGFPHIPGEDWANAYARQGERHDGSSLYR
ncbi:MAG: DUF2163 domain-containing protein [Alphaproteobacteria bacterium]|nr:MAG: DUF2163 domain-containing protein [Alphaproteobacteria bacterium]